MSISEPETMSSLLKGVSRSFYLSLRLLPRSVRTTLCLAYLLARASDSIADTATTSCQHRVDMLSGLPEKWGEATELKLRSEAEEALLEALPALLRQVERSPDRGEILGVWRTILSGQIFDLRHFSQGAPALTLEEGIHYAGLVAGSVGQFWTEVCFKHVPGYSKESLEEMCGLGFDYGCGLQWINILRDRHEDAAAGRIYVTPENFPMAMRVVQGNLASGARYVDFVRPRRLRAACRLPLEIGRRTLELVSKNPQEPRVKVSRKFVWFSLMRTLWH